MNTTESMDEQIESTYSLTRGGILRRYIELAAAVWGRTPEDFFDRPMAHKDTLAEADAGAKAVCRERIVLVDQMMVSVCDIACAKAATGCKEFVQAKDCSRHDISNT